MYNINLVKTSYAKEDVTILLKDIGGLVIPIPTEEREKLNQKGTHYSEMLPLEYKPTQEYMKIYEESLKVLSYKTANATAILSEMLYEKYGNRLVIVSLARAGTPIGILIKRYIQYKYQITLPHYSISIIRDKGIDKNAMQYIVEKHGTYGIQFVDGWIGKGAINHVLVKACDELKAESKQYYGLDGSLGVLSDPAYITKWCGTHEDFLIPSACLNATVSGLISRTFHRKDIIGEQDFHGAIYYGDMIAEDRSNEFIDTVCSYFNQINHHYFQNAYKMPAGKHGIDEVLEIGKCFGITDINKIKPGVGETTRVLLRRIPDMVLVRDKSKLEGIEHILRLCEEKQVKVIEYPMKMYNVCGIIKTLAEI